MRVGVLLVLVVGIGLIVLAFLQHFQGVITADHVAVAFGIIGFIVFVLGAFMALVSNN